MPETKLEAVHRVSAWEWTQTALLAANLAWTTLCLGGFMAKTMVVTSALTGALVAVHFLARALEKNPAPRVHPAGWLFGPFLVYAAINVRWITPVRWLGWRDWFGWAEMIAVFWVVLNGVRSPAPRRALLATLAAIGVVVVALACYQRLGHHEWMMLGRTQLEQYVGRASGSFGIPNSFAALMLLLLAPAGALALCSRRHRVVTLVLALGLALGLVLSISRGAWISLALVLIASPLVAVRGHWVRRLGIAFAALAAVVALGGALYALSPAVHERFTALARDAGERSRPILWRAAWAMFREHPAVGTGAGSFNVLFEKYRPEGFLHEPVWAHNDYLNTLSDYGAVGFVLFFGACGAIALRCRLNRNGAAFASDATDIFASRAFTTGLALGLAAFALQLFVDFHLKIAALAMTLATLAALLVQRTWQSSAPDAPPTSRAKMLSGLTAAVAAAGAIGFVVPRFYAEALRFRGHDAIDRIARHRLGAEGYRDALAGARADFVRAVAIDPANAQAWADLSYAVSLVPHAEPQRSGDRPWLVAVGREAEVSAQRALALTSTSAEFFVRRGVALDLQGRWLEAGSDFAQAVALSPAAPLIWYYYAYHLSLNESEQGMTDSALEFCLRLDPSNHDGLALRQHLAISRRPP